MDGCRRNNDEFKTDRSTHNGGHVAAFVGGGHQGAELGLAAQAGCRKALVLHAFGHSWRQQTRGAAVVAVAAIP